jgi:hypothetical protein
MKYQSYGAKMQLNRESIGMMIALFHAALALAIPTDINEGENCVSKDVWHYASL